MGNEIDQKKEALAESIKTRSSIKDPTSVAFEITGNKAAEIITNELEAGCGSLNRNLHILDFGSGSGRVSIPLIKKNPSLELHCTDVDAEAIEYLSLCLPTHCKAAQANYLPPLSYPDEYFDAVFSISVWSHFPADLGFEWLKEMHRICKKGALLLISKAGYNVIDHWKKNEKQWENITAEHLDKEKFIYKEFFHIHTNEIHYPGISSKGSWGNTLIHDNYISEEWGQLFSIEEIKQGRMNGMQDLVLMRK